MHHMYSGCSWSDDKDIYIVAWWVHLYGHWDILFIQISRVARADGKGVDVTLLQFIWSISFCWKYNAGASVCMWLREWYLEPGLALFIQSCLVQPPWQAVGSTQSCVHLECTVMNSHMWVFLLKVRCGSYSACMRLREWYLEPGLALFIQSCLVQLPCQAVRSTQPCVYYKVYWYELPHVKL